jgi:curved DNA-binding protein CbpA
VKDKKDKRRFRRYKRGSNFELSVGGSSFKAEIVDYSADGLGVLVDDSPSIAEGMIIALNIAEPHVHTNGTIVWLRRTKSGTRAGIKKSEPLEGSLRDYNLADIFIGLQRSGRTGVLEIRSGSILKRVYVKNGDMIFSSSNQDEDRLGDILLREGKINLEQYNRSVEALKETGKRQGTILVELGYLKPGELIWAVRHQVEEIILSLFGLDDGTFEFREAPLIMHEVITLKLSAANLIYRGIKKIKEAERLQRLRDLFGLSMETQLSFSVNPLDLFQDITLDEVGKEILSYIHGKTAIKDILSLSRLSESEILKTLYALLSTGIVEIIEEGGDTIDMSADEIFREPEMEIPQEVRERIEDIYSRHDSLGYYGILGIKEWATPGEIKNAYYEAAKEFHPDRHFYLESDELKSKLHTIFSFVTEAYTTLSDHEKRRQYDRQLSYKSTRTLSNEELAEAKFEEGKIELAKYNIGQAAELFAQTAYLNSSSAKHHYYYGLALSKLGKFKEATRAIEKAVKIKPSDADYLAELGFLYLKLGFTERAKGTFQKALRLSPSHRKASEGMMNLT